MTGVLHPAQRAATVATLVAAQHRSGMVGWFEGGHADAWNHTQALMAMGTGGYLAEAVRGFEWLASTQRPDGAWHQYYASDGSVEVALLDANVTAYVACGVWHHLCLTGDMSFAEGMWPVVEAAMGFVLGLARPGGEITWARHPDGTPWSFALLTASASTYRSLRSAASLARVLGRPRPRWESAADRLAHAVARRPRAFSPKDRWSMDWYYPVLAGILTGAEARARLAGGWERFAMEGLGIRCVSDRPWVTAAETSECAMAHLLAGDPQRATDLLAWAHHLRADDGSYYTGMVHPERVHFPGGERSTYSAATVVLASDLLANPWSATARLFTGAGAGRHLPVKAATGGEAAR